MSDSPTSVVPASSGSCQNNKSSVLRHGIQSFRRRAGANPQAPQNSLFFSTCMTISAMIGVGILNQAYVFYDSGIFGGLLVYALCVWFIYSGEVIPVRCGLSINVLEYDHLCETLCGNAAFHVSIISSLGFAFLDVVAMINVIGSLVTDLVGDDNEYMEYVITTGLVIFIMGPICLFRHYGHFAELTVFAVTLVFILVLYVSIGGPILREKEDSTEDTEYNDPIVWFRPLGIVRQIGSVMFAMDFGYSIFPIFQSLKNPTYERWTTNTRIATAIGTAFLILVGVFGYLSFRDDTSGDVIENFPTDLRYLWLYVIVIVHTTAFFPTSLYVVILFTFKLIWHRDEHTVDRIKAIPTPKYACIVYATLALCTLIVFSLWLSGLSNAETLTVVVDVAGGTFAAIICLILPGLIGVNYHRLAVHGRSREAKRGHVQRHKETVGSTFSPMVGGDLSSASEGLSAGNSEGRITGVRNGTERGVCTDLEPLSWQDHAGSWAVLCFGIFAIVAVPASIILDAFDVI